MRVYLSQLAPLEPLNQLEPLDQLDPLEQLDQLVIKPLKGGFMNPIQISLQAITIHRFPKILFFVTPKVTSAARHKIKSRANFRYKSLKFSYFKEHFVILIGQQLLYLNDVIAKMPYIINENPLKKPSPSKILRLLPHKWIQSHPKALLDASNL